MEKLKQEILQAVQDSTDLTDNIVSIPILSHFLDGILNEQFAINGVMQANPEKVCEHEDEYWIEDEGGDWYCGECEEGIEQSLKDYKNILKQELINCR
jgi:hypothetical protein